MRQRPIFIVRPPVQQPMVEEVAEPEPRVIIEKVPVYIPVPQKIRQQPPVTIIKNFYGQEEESEEPAPETYNKVVVNDDQDDVS